MRTRAAFDGRCLQCGYCAACHAQTGYCPERNTSCVIGNDCGRAYAKRQLVDDVVRDLVSEYPGTVQSVNLPTPDTALVRLHRGGSTWLVSLARLEVTP